MLSTRYYNVGLRWPVRNGVMKRTRVSSSPKIVIRCSSLAHHAIANHVAARARCPGTVERVERAAAAALALELEQTKADAHHTCEANAEANAQKVTIWRQGGHGNE